MADHTPQAVRERLRRAIEANRDEMQAQHDTTPGQDVAELEEALEGVLEDEGKRGEAAAVVLFMLALARGVRARER